MICSIYSLVHIHLNELCYFSLSKLVENVIYNCITILINSDFFSLFMNREDFTDEEWESLRNAVKLYLEDGGEVA
jgi:hypothetical protein